MAERRRGVYIWVTWLTGLVAGADHCWWAAWFRAHYKHEKDRSGETGALDLWRANHGREVATEAERLKKQGYQVTIEDKNAARVDGATATVAFKPDLLGRKGGDDPETKTVDVKTGQRRDSDPWQLQFYLWLASQAWPDTIGTKIRAELFYTKTNERVPIDMPTPEERAHLRNAIHKAASDEAPPRVPSRNECQFCDIGREDCPQKWVPPPVTMQGTPSEELGF